MKLRLLLALCICLPSLAGAEDEVTIASIQGSYFAVIVSDIEGSRNWYQTVLGLKEVNRLNDRGRYDIINMAGPGLFVELLKLDAAAARPGGQIEGPFKVGMLVDDLTAFAAGLPAVASEAEIVYDGRASVLLLQLKDPDNNTVQVMQVVDEE
jgi:catechol 2,3-dioxygenase-like lactoylglutathione lyase family enzyme